MGVPAPEPDGMRLREANAWAQDKLDIVECYVSGFARACAKAGGGVVVDGFAGPGINQFKDSGELRYGTPLIALHTKPRVSKVIATDLSTRDVSTLAVRAERFGSRAVIEQGDVNRDLAPLIRSHVHPRAPCLVVLDPEGTELAFDTVKAIADSRGPKRPELLILLATHIGFLRLLWDRGLEDWVYPKMDRLYGTRGWHDIYERRIGEEIDTDTATTEYVRLYAKQLRTLGYTHVSDREIRARGREGRLGYFLLFAGDHPVGVDIMEHCFDTQFGGQPTLFHVDRPTRL